MLIVNADDWGRTRAETDAILQCCQSGRVTSVSAMVFMEDSERAAGLANGIGLDVGLHLNFDESFSGKDCPPPLVQRHEKTKRYLKSSKYAQLVFNPFLREEFAASYAAQADEFVRLYGRGPSHVDGHHHMHLCANVLFSRLVPAGMKMRRNFSFWPGEKSWLNRLYRAWVDRFLARRYVLPDYFFCISQSLHEQKFERVESLSRSSSVELMTHPGCRAESEYLLSEGFCAFLGRVPAGTYGQLQAAPVIANGIN
jgi:chitin disaccharide deacetylase